VEFASYLGAIIEYYVRLSNPTVSNAKVPEAIAKRVGFTKEEQARLITPNYDYLAKTDSQLKEWWDKVFKA